MSLFSQRNRNVPHFINGNHDQNGLDEARHAAWVVAASGIRPSADPPRQRRLSRADLPDVDFSRAVPVARNPSLIRRMVHWLGLASERPAYLADEWRVMRAAPEPAAPSRPGENVIPINRAA